MWVSTKAQYGMRALVEVATWGGEPGSLKTIAERQLISHQYLEQIFALLRRAGIVDSVRGARGGYKLARPLDEIDALEVVELLEGSVAPVRCIDDATHCMRTGRCSTASLWRRVDSAAHHHPRRPGGAAHADRRPPPAPVPRRGRLTMEHTHGGAVYLDHAATTPVDERVLEAMLPFLREEFGNPSSVHRLGQRARRALE